MSTDSIFRPAFVLMSGRAVGLVAAFAIPIVLARFFDQSEFGTYKQLFLIYGSLYSIAQLGMAEGLFYFLPSAERSGGHYAFNAMLALGVAGSVCFAVLWGAQTTIAGWLNNEALIGLIPLIGIFLMLTLTSAVLEIVMTSRKHHFYAFAAFALTDVLRAALFVVPAVWLGGIEWLLWGGIAFAIVRLGATVAYLVREYGDSFRPDFSLARRQIAYAAPFCIYVLVEVMQGQLHLYAVSSRFDAATFAVYAVGCLSIPLVEFLASSTGNVMMVRMREQMLSGASASLLATWRDTTRKLALIFVPLVGALLVVAHELIVVLFTSTYASSVPIFMVWVLTFLFSILLTDSLLRVCAEIRFLMLLGFIKLAFVAVTIGWFMSTFGLLGAILVMLATIMLAKVLALARIKIVLGCRVSELLPWRGVFEIVVIAAIAAVPALLVKSALAMPALPLMLVTGSVYAGVCFALVWRFGPLRDDEKFALMRAVQRPFIAAPGRG